MEFERYQHVERFGNEETEGIEIGECYIFYKLDGTNASVWYNEGIQAGSRNRHLTLEKDNAGFLEAISKNEKIINFFNQNKDVRLYGEWLVPHSLNTYREDSWRKFYIFDVWKDGKLMHFLDYSKLLDEYELSYIPPLCTIKNPTYEKLVELLEKTGNYLIKDGQGNGEGIVVKNYSYKNRYGRQTWAKLVTNEFKEKNAKIFGVPELKAELSIEERFIDKYCTESFIEKEFNKIKIEKDGWTSKYIPMLLGKVFYELVNEETYNAIKEFGFPTINFKRLNQLVIGKIKEVKPELFK